MSNLISLAYPSLLHTQAEKPTHHGFSLSSFCRHKKKEKEKLNKKLLLARVATARQIHLDILWSSLLFKRTTHQGHNMLLLNGYSWMIKYIFIHQLLLVQH